MSRSPEINKLKVHQTGASLALKGLVMLAVPLCIQIGLIGGIIYVQDRAEKYAFRAERETAFRELSDQFMLGRYDAARRVEQTISNNTAGNTASNTTAVRDVLAVEAAARGLAAILRNQAEMTQARLVPVLRDTHTMVQSSRRTRAIVGLSNLALSREPPGSPRRQQLLDRVQTLSAVERQRLICEGELEHHKVAITPEYWAKDRSFWANILLAGAMFDLLWLLIVGIFFGRTIIRRLHTITDNNRRLANDRELHPRLSGGDELAKLDAAFHDMAEALKQATHLQRSMVDNARDIICSIDSHGKFLSINNACREIFGYQPEELIGKWISDLVETEQQTLLAERLRQVMAQGIDEPLETRIIRKDGSSAEVLWLISWSAHDQTMFCVAHDISRRKAAERVRQQVMQMASQDLRAPLISIRSFYQTLKQRPLSQNNQEASKMIDLADRNAGRMLGLLDDLTDMEQIEAGTLKLEFSPTSLSSVIEQSLQSVILIAQSKGVMLEVTQTQARIWADEHRLVQVLVNLLSNAIKFTPAGKKITVSVEESQDFIEVAVNDEGRGIPPHKLEAIFRRFSQVQSSDATRLGGTGLGLTICKALVELHGGTIKVESHEAAGSTFSFRIPKRTAPSPADDGGGKLRLFAESPLEQPWKHR